MSKRASKKEESLYEPIMKALKRVFSCLGECHLEISAKGFSNKVKKAFDDVALYMITVERFFPDISGFVKTKYSTDIITVEVKPEKPMIKDVFQTKDYAQIFNAKYSILVSPKAISEERRRLILKRRELISRYGREPVVIARFDKVMEEFEIDEELYYGSLPEPFKSHRKALEAENLTFAMDFDKKAERPMVVVTNVGGVAVKIAEATLAGQSLLQNVALEPGGRTQIEVPKDWSNWIRRTGARVQLEVITEIGKKFSFEIEAS